MQVDLYNGRKTDGCGMLISCRISQSEAWCVNILAYLAVLVHHGTNSGQSRILPNPHLFI